MTPTEQIAHILGRCPLEVHGYWAERAGFREADGETREAAEAGALGDTVRYFEALNERRRVG